MNIMFIVVIMTGEQLQTIRKRMGWTQEAIAKELGITSQSVSRYERNAEPIPRYIQLAVKQLEAREKGK